MRRGEAMRFKKKVRARMRRENDKEESREGAFFDTPSFFMFIRNRKDSHENFP